MRCAYHATVDSQAFCSTCNKPLCSECTHQVNELEMSGHRRERDFKQVLFIPLDNDQCTVSPEL